MTDNTFYGVFVSEMFLTYPGRKQYAADEYVDNFGLTHAAMGVAGEAGELVDLIKKHVFTGKPLHYDQVIAEMGDLEFYLQALRNQLQIDREDVLKANVTKLEGRHPKGIEESNHYEK